MLVKLFDNIRVIKALTGSSLIGWVKIAGPTELPADTIDIFSKHVDKIKEPLI